MKIEDLLDLCHKHHIMCTVNYDGRWISSISLRERETVLTISLFYKGTLRSIINPLSVARIIGNRYYIPPRMEALEKELCSYHSPLEGVPGIIESAWYIDSFFIPEGDRIANQYPYFDDIDRLRNDLFSSEDAINSDKADIIMKVLEVYND